MEPMYIAVSSETYDRFVKRQDERNLGSDEYVALLLDLETFVQEREDAA